MKIRALIVDDEQLARQRVRLLLAEEPNVEVIGECADLSKASVIPENRSWQIHTTML